MRGVMGIQGVGRRGPGGERVRLIEAWFDVRGRAGWKDHALRRRVRMPAVRTGRIVLIAGASGAGKSTLLRAYRRRLRRRRRGCRVIDLARVRLAERAVIELFPRLSIEAAL